MSARTIWPTWVTQTLKYEALVWVLPMYGVTVWLIAGLWLLAWTKAIELQSALLMSVVVSVVYGGMVTLVYFAFQSGGFRKRLYNAGKAEALIRSLGAGHYLNWQWFVFGWLIILVNFIQPKRTAD